MVFITIEGMTVNSQHIVEIGEVENGIPNFAQGYGFLIFLSTGSKDTFFVRKYPHRFNSYEEAMEGREAFIEFLNESDYKKVVKKLQEEVAVLRSKIDDFLNN